MPDNGNGQGNGGGGNGDTPTPEEKSIWRSEFAKGSFLAALVLAAVVLARPFEQMWVLSLSDWKGADGNRFLGASLSLPLTVVGGVLVAIGAWMAVVEWRGRFQEQPKDDGVRTAAAPSLPDIIAAVGKLKGAALVMVVGALLMLASAWVAQSASQPPATPAATTTP